MPQDPRERLVSSGSFRVDRNRALDKLMRFQLPEARMYPLPWVQAAVAGGALGIRIVPQPAGLEFSFDGKPWTVAELNDPYRHLFDDDPDGSKTRNRELAIGLLTALRIPPDHITATFVDEEAQYVLHIRDITNEHIEPAGTVDPKAPLMSLFVAVKTSFAKEREFLEHYARHCPIPVTIARARLQVSGEVRGALSARFDHNGISGGMFLPEWAPPHSRIDLVTHGVIVAEETLKLPGIQVEGWVRNDGFRKTLSQMGVVKDAFYLQAMGALSQYSQHMLKEAAARAWQKATACGQILADEGMRLCWMPWETANLAERLGSLVAPGTRGRSVEAAVVREQSVLVSALRQAALHRRADIVAERSADGLHDILADAPVLFDALGRPLSLRPLLAQARWLGHVPTVDSRRVTAQGPLTAVWVVREVDRQFLEAFFPERVRGLRDDAAAVDPAARPVLDDPSLLVKRPFMAGPVSGEVGLSISPHPRTSRLRWIGANGPLGTIVWDLRGLRMEATLHHPGLSALPREQAPTPEARAALSALMAEAPALYQLLAREYAPDEDTPRMAAVREHLMDFMRLTYDAQNLDTPAVPWLARIPLMLDKAGRRVSLEDLRNRSAAGEKTPVRASVHPARLAPLVSGYPDHMAQLFGDSPRIELLGALPPPAAPPAASAVRLPKTTRHEPKPAKEAAPRQDVKLPKTARVEPAAAAGEDLVADPGEELRAWLSEIKRQGSCSVPEATLAALRLVKRGRGRFIQYMPDSSWELDAGNPLAAPLAALAPDAAMPYLVSITHSGINRALSGLTDAQDAVFTEALARLALEKDGG